MERLAFVLTWFFQGSSYLSAYGYGVMHRMHHAHTDTENDPHSPSHDANLFAMMWKTRNTYQDINTMRVDVDQRFTQNVPQWKSFDRFASSRFSRLLWISVYASVFFSVCQYMVGVAFIPGDSVNGTHTWCDYQLVRSCLWLCEL